MASYSIRTSVTSDTVSSTGSRTGSSTTSSTSTSSSRAVSSAYTVAWKTCNYCDIGERLFRSPREFCQHLRDFHCTREGGSFICRYGANAVCPSLPIDGVSDKDYEDHVARVHVASVDRHTKMSSSSPGNSEDIATSSSATSSYSASAASSEPSVVQDQHKWTIFHSKVNLPAVLNDPRLARRETDFFSKTWGESFEKKEIYPSPHLQNITRDYFKKYLKRTTKRFEQHVQGVNVVPLHPNSTDDIPVVSVRQQEKQRAALASIPKIFLQQGFSLENADTFNAVFPWSQIEAGKQNPIAGSKNQSPKLLQEKLSHYLDVVEVQIAKQISLRSDAFFHAMSSHDALQEHMNTTCRAIQNLRNKMKHLNEVLVMDPLTIMKHAKNRANYVAIKNKLKLMATVHQTQPTIQMLLSTNEFVGALDLIATTQEVLAQELQGVVCFRHLGSQLAELEKLIDKMMQEDFIKYTNLDLQRPLHDPEPLLDQEKLVSIVLGMLRQRKFHFIDVYKDEAATALKAAVKQTVIEAVSEADNIEPDDASASLADQMRLLNYKQWMTLLNKVFSNLLVILNRVKGMVLAIEGMLQVTMTLESVENRQPLSSIMSDASEVLFEQEEEIDVEAAAIESPDGSDDVIEKITNGAESGAIDLDQMLSHGECLKVAAQLRDMLYSVCNHGHERCVKLLMARSKDGFLEKLSSSEFVHLSRAIESFVSSCAGISGRKSTALRTCLHSQANRFVTRFHEERKNKLSLILDNERWKQADVPSEFQDLVDHISTSGLLSLPRRKLDIEARPEDCLVLGDEKFAVVGTVLLLLKMMVEYCQVVDDLPTATADILSRLIELLKMFNSRTCQLILGAGAVQLVGLKNISTKNLVLASRCLQLVIVYIPMVKTHFEMRLAEKQHVMLKHFDQVLKDYNDHVSELSNKLVTIMDGMFEVHLSKWEVKAPMPSTCFRNICKQISRLHEAIAVILPPAQIMSLFQRVHSSFKLHLRSQLIKLGVCSDGGPQHGLVVSDVAFYTGSIKSLAGMENLDDSMDDIWDKT